MSKDDDDNEKEGRVVQLRVLKGGGEPGPHTDHVMAEQMRKAVRRAQLLNLLELFKQRVLAGEVEFLAIAGKMHPPPLSNGEVSTAIAPIDYNRFEVMGILNAMLHFETLKLTTQREEPTVPDPPKPSG
jgi:hypothetical protein